MFKTGGAACREETHSIHGADQSGQGLLVHNTCPLGPNGERVAQPLPKYWPTYSEPRDGELGSARWIVPGRPRKEVLLSMEKLGALEAMTSEELQRELGEGVSHAALPSRDDLRAHLGVARDLSLTCLYPQAVSCPKSRCDLDSQE